MEINNNLIFDFKNYLQYTIGRNEKYCRENIYGINEFLQWLKWARNTRTIQVEDVFIEDIDDFSTYLQNKPAGRTSRYYWEWSTLALRTVQMRITAVKNFFKRLKRRKKIEISIDLNDIEMPKNKSRKVSFLTNEEVREILEHILKTETDPATRMRNSLLVKIPFNSGLRKDELLNLRISDVQRGCSFEIIGKGWKSRLVNINEELRLEILAYADYVSFRSEMRLLRTKFNNDFVFISHATNTFGTRLSGQFASNIIKGYSNDMKRVCWRKKSRTLHTLRHSFASQAVKDDVHIVVLKEMLWHESIATTNIYTHVDDKFIRKNYEKITKVY